MCLMELSSEQSGRDDNSPAEVARASEEAEEMSPRCVFGCVPIQGLHPSCVRLIGGYVITLCKVLLQFTGS